MLRLRHVAPLLPLIALVAGCAPQTRFRRTAFVPTPRADSLTQEVRGDVELVGEANVTDVGYDWVPEVGDPALHAAHTEFQGQARFRVGRHFALGAQALYSHTGLSRATTVGTPPMSGESLYGVGPNVSMHFGGGIDDSRMRWGFGMGLALQFVSVPYSVWERNDGGTSLEDIIDPEASNYHLVESGRDVHGLVALSIGGTFGINEYVDLFGGVSIQNSMTNIGFDDQQRDGSTITAGEVGAVPFLGVTGHVPGGLLLRAQYGFPIGFSQFYADDTSWGTVQFTIGAELGGERGIAPEPTTQTIDLSNKPDSI